jgi:hypothetical protein
MDFKSIVNNKDSMKKIIPVPYISQYSNSIEKDWQNRSCGIACVAMLLGYYNLEDNSPMKLINEGVSIGGYCNQGWFHESLVRLLRNHGVNAYAQEFRSVNVSPENKTFEINSLETKMIDEGLVKIIQEIDSGHPVMLSVGPGFNTNKENHLILIIGYDLSDKKEQFIIHDPDAVTEETMHIEMFVDIAKIRKFWRKFAIFSYL